MPINIAKNSKGLICPKCGTTDISEVPKTGGKKLKCQKCGVLPSKNYDSFKEKSGIQTYQAWKKAVKALDPEASFTGDKDIDSAFVNKWYDAEWDGDKGEIRSMVK